MCKMNLVKLSYIGKKTVQIFNCQVKIIYLYRSWRWIRNPLRFPQLSRGFGPSPAAGQDRGRAVVPWIQWFAKSADQSQGEKCAAANSNKILLVVSVVTVSFKRRRLRAEEGAVSAGSCSLRFVVGAAEGRSWQQEQSNTARAAPRRARELGTLGAATSLGAAPGAASLGEWKAATLLEKKQGRKSCKVLFLSPTYNSCRQVAPKSFCWREWGVKKHGTSWICCTLLFLYWPKITFEQKRFKAPLRFKNRNWTGLSWGQNLWKKFLPALILWPLCVKGAEMSGWRLKVKHLVHLKQAAKPKYRGIFTFNRCPAVSISEPMCVTFYFVRADFGWCLWT